MRFTDRILRCVGCGADFLLTVEEQQELITRGFAPQRRYCQACQPDGEIVSELVGRVKWFDERRGYGFIEQEDGQDVFVHYSAIRGQGYRTLIAGETVRFRVEQGPKGAQALDVVRLSGPSTSFTAYSATRLVRL